MGMNTSSKTRSGLISFRSLRAKFLVVVVPLVLLSTLIVFGLFELNAQREAHQRLEGKLEKLVAIQSAVVAESFGGSKTRARRRHFAAADRRTMFSRTMRSTLFSSSALRRGTRLISCR